MARYQRLLKPDKVKNMPKPDKDKLWAKLEETGESEVRIKYASGVYGQWKIPLVEEWLKRKEKQSSEMEIFDSILLEIEQRELLVSLVEASRNVTRQNRQKFFAAEDMGWSAIIHPGLPDGKISAYLGDLNFLENENLVSISYDSIGRPSFDVTPKGFKYYEQLKEQEEHPVQRIETTMKSCLASDIFQKKYSNAYQKWSNAEKLLWVSDSEKQFTTIGHNCREAMQEFATALVNLHKPDDVEKDVSKTVKRIMAVLKKQANKLGTTEESFLKNLLNFWRSVSDLVQRQEHGGQKENEPLVWEDGRRVVFQTAIVMYEIDSSLSRNRIK